MFPPVEYCRHKTVTTYIHEYIVREGTQVVLQINGKPVISYVVPKEEKRRITLLIEGVDSL